LSSIVPELDRNRLDALMHLQWVHYERFQARRNWEWRLTFTLWGGLAVTANALREVKDLDFRIWLVVGLAIIVMHGLWERFISNETYRNRLYGQRINKQINEMIGFDPGDDNRPPRPRRWWGRPAWEPKPLDQIVEHKESYAHYWQVAVTAILVCVTGAVLYL
jgi:hypothetical protein